MMFETPGKIDNLHFQTRNKDGQWITQYEITLDKQPTYEMVADWYTTFIKDTRFTKVSGYRVVTYQDKKATKDDEDFTEMNMVLTQQGYELYHILASWTTMLITVSSDGKFIETWAKKNPIIPSFEKFWKKYVWNRDLKGIKKIRKTPVTNDDNQLTTYVIEFNHGEKITLSTWDVS